MNLPATYFIVFSEKSTMPYWLFINVVSANLLGYIPQERQGTSG